VVLVYFFRRFTVYCVDFFLAAKGYLGFMPGFDILENPKSNLSTQIFSDDGKVIGKFYFNENRTPVRYDELSPYLIKALVAYRRRTLLQSFGYRLSRFGSCNCLHGNQRRGFYHYSTVVKTFVS